MLKQSVSVIVLMHIIWTNTSYGQAAPPELQKKFDEILQRHSLPGGAGAVVANNDVLVKVASGIRRTGDPTPLTIDDKLHIGSCTKAMTATLAGILVDDGQLTWETALADVFTELRDEIHTDYRDVTVSQLLSHYSGAPPNCMWDRLGKDKPLPEQRMEMIRRVFTKPPRIKPHESYLYSNVGVVAVGAIVEKITGRSWEELMRERLFVPLKMTSAGFGPPSIDGSLDQPWGHRSVLFQVRSSQIDNPPALGPAGTVHLSLDDWCRFASLHLGTTDTKPPLLSAASLKQLHTPYPELNSRVKPTPDPYGFGWISLQRPWAGGKALFHNGSNTSWYSVIWLAPEKHAAFVAVVNSGDESATKATDEMIVELINHWSALPEDP